MAALLAAGCGGLLRRQPPLHPHNPEGTWYIVQPGETLADIAARARVPLEDLLEINGLSRADAVEPGRLVFVLYPDAPLPPGARPPPGAAPPPPPGPAPPPVPAVAALLRWPLAEPRISSPFGTRWGQPHEGIDLAAPLGTPIYAADAGRVLYAGDAVRGYGNMIVLEHAAGLLTVYAHNSVLLVKTGDPIAAGQEIARVGQSGRATAPHLHFEVRRGQVPQDPLRFLPPLKGAR